MMSSTSEQYDAKKFPLCAPWDGQRGKSFLESFLPDITFAWGLRGDDFANKQQHLIGAVSPPSPHGHARYPLLTLSHPPSHPPHPAPTPPPTPK